jgi:putative endonuclease
MPRDAARCGILEAEVHMAAKDDLGRRGEALAADYLVEHGMRLVERNWRCGQGEIDLVAQDGDELVFVEVKTRSSVGFGHPLEAITIDKLARLRRLAAAWCAAHPGRHGLVRIDAVAVIAPARGPVVVEHVKRVF